MIDVILYGRLPDVQKYCKAFVRNSLAECSVSHVTNEGDFSKVVISIKSDNLYAATLKVDGFQKIGLNAKVVLDPYVIEFSKFIGDSSIRTKQKLCSQTSQLGEYEDLESYDLRMGYSYVG